MIVGREHITTFTEIFSMPEFILDLCLYKSSYSLLTHTVETKIHLIEQDFYSQ